MEHIYIKARAKINLNLLILNRRIDGYHNLKSIFQKINLYDELLIQKTNKNSIEIETNINELKNENNIIYKAYFKLKNDYKKISGIKVILNKKIPIQAGMGGGSSDCASFILGMNKLFNLNLKKTEIINLGESLGADVVPCLYNKAILAEGIGNIVTEINTNFQYYIIIIKPKFVCNTKEMFEKFDNEKDKEIMDSSENIIKALKDDDIELLSQSLYNSFETVVNVKTIKKEIIENKAMGALLTGSGSCVYGIYKNKNEAKIAYNNLKEKYETYICTSYNSKNNKF